MLAGVPPEGGDRAAALCWVLSALDCVAQGDLRYKLPAATLLASTRLWPHPSSEMEEGFVDARRKAARSLERAGVQLEREYFLTKGVIGHLGCNLPPFRGETWCGRRKITQPRQDMFMRGLPLVLHDFCREKWGVPKLFMNYYEEGYDAETEGDKVYCAFLCTAAHALDARFQAEAETICRAAGGTGRAGRPKSYSKMLSKLCEMHEERNAIFPRSAENLDVIRVAWTFDEPSQLLRAFDGAAKRFGAPLLVKNGYSGRYDSIIESKGFRCLRANYLYVPIALTWGMLAGEEDTVKAWDGLRKKILDMFIVEGYSNEESLPLDDRRSLADLDESRRLLTDEEKYQVLPVKLIVEVQFLLRPYLELRKRTSHLDRLWRSKTAEAMLRRHIA